MNTAEEVNLCVKRTNLVDSTSVNTLALVKKPAANDELLKLIHAIVDLCDIVGINLVELLVNSGVDRTKCLVTDSLVVCIKSNLNIVNGELLDSLEHLGSRIV